MELTTKAPLIAVVAKRRKTLEVLTSQISECFGGNIRITGWCMDDGLPGRIEADLLVAGSRTVASCCSQLISPAVKVLVARRCLNHDELPKLLEIQAGIRALLVNDLPETAEETVRLIREAGIDHFHLEPYAPGMPVPPDCDIAVTPGEVDLVPRHIHAVIDIGTRGIDITSLAEIAFVLGLQQSSIELLTSRFIRAIVRHAREAVASAREEARAREFLEAVLQVSADGIIGVDDDGRVCLMNESASRKLEVQKHAVIGAPPDELFRSAAAEVRGDVITVGRKQYLVSRQRVKAASSNLSSVILLRDVTTVHEMEGRLRGRAAVSGFEARYDFACIVGNSTVMKRTIELAKRIAAGTGTVLILGETGTGKELFAHSIHRASPRSSGPFVTVNFANVPVTLLESELFGYEEGAFTGARRGGKPGLFEQANGGTLFLDEIGDAPLDLQGRLLRVLEEGHIRRVGGTKNIPVDVRVIAATNKNLERLMQEGEFRADLYYRLNVLPIVVPPLRERREDIPLLIEAYNGRLLTHGRQPIQFTHEAVNVLMRYDWPGNVRELFDTLEYLSTLSDGTPISPEALPRQFRSRSRKLSVESPDESGRDASEIVAAIHLDPARDELVAILTALASTRHGSMGRRKLASTAEAHGLCLTEARVRRLARLLSDMGLVKISTGREGIAYNVSRADRAETDVRVVLPGRLVGDRPDGLRDEAGRNGSEWDKPANAAFREG